MFVRNQMFNLCQLENCKNNMIEPPFINRQPLGQTLHTTSKCPLQAYCRLLQRQRDRTYQIWKACTKFQCLKPFTTWANRLKLLNSKAPLALSLDFLILLGITRFRDTTKKTTEKRGGKERISEPSYFLQCQPINLNTYPNENTISKHNYITTMYNYKFNKIPLIMKHLLKYKSHCRTHNQT